MQFHVANKEFRNSGAGKKCTNKLFQQEVINKNRTYSILEKYLNMVKDELLLGINFIDYNHAYDPFLVKH